MAERLEEKCEHPKVELIIPEFSHPFYGKGKCLECGKRGIVIDTDYESTEKRNVYRKKEE